jgi:hypothetical protein
MVMGTTRQPFRGFDCIIMPLGNHALNQQSTIIDAAIAARMRHFYPSEFRPDLLVGQNWTQRYYRDISALITRTTELKSMG